MARLEDLTTGTRVTGLTATGTATVESAQWIGEHGLKVIYRDADGGLGERFVYLHPSLDIAGAGVHGAIATSALLDLSRIATWTPDQSEDRRCAVRSANRTSSTARWG